MPRRSAKTPAPVKEAKAWEQQADESAKNFEAFRIYRDLGASNRSTSKVAKELNKSADMMQEWCAKHQWVARCSAFDQWEDFIRIREKRKAIMSMATRHARIAMGFQEKVVARLKAIQVADMSIGECIRMMQVMTKIERDARAIAPREIIPEEDEQAPAGKVIKIIRKPKDDAYEADPFEEAANDEDDEGDEDEGDDDGKS